VSINRRQLLGSSLAAAAAAGPLGAMASPAHAGPQQGTIQRAAFDLVLCDAARNVVETVNTGTVSYPDGTNKPGVFGKPKSTFRTGGWAPLECRFRDIKKIGRVFMVCGGTPDNGKVTIHRQSDSRGVGADSGLWIFPHCVEYIPDIDAVIVVGTRGPKRNDKRDPRTQGSYVLYNAPDGTPGSFTRLTEPRRFRQAHGVLWDPKRRLLWVYGWDSLVGYSVHRSGRNIDLRPQAVLHDRSFINGHDLQPDYVDDRFFWATGTHAMFKVYKAQGNPRIVWSYGESEAKSFSRHESGRGVYTTAHYTSPHNPYGDNKVRFLWPQETVRQPHAKWIYKARLTNHELPGA